MDVKKLWLDNARLRVLRSVSEELPKVTEKMRSLEKTAERIQKILSEQLKQLSVSHVHEQDKTDDYTKTITKNSNPLDDNDTSTECSAMITDTKSLSVLKNNSENKKVEQKSYASLIQGAT
ncbi:uncharacterized protein LOC105205336 isoform X1 [Solenopsis invicta]|uniref:uncharacterized protein LOC105205336 isoform X1 n=1 Tax=Solenopsis invicta TaxID=13686 RepID=UPI000E3401DF|nr:uncharacterized protein LOC105205336 isoform X1 [Solenopsis invicta]XP_039307856.1 uncharacterized protein LOC105205336 isoform X1 [Solenopsis invicta]